MALKQLWTIGYRDLGRNRRRSIFSLLAVALGLALLIMMSGFIAGMLESALQDNIRLSTGHVQVRAESYEVEKQSLLARDLLADSEALSAQANSMSEVAAATPVLWAAGVLGTSQESVGLQVTGIDPSSPVHAPMRDGLVAGELLAPDDRRGVVISKRLADSMGISVGQRVSLALGTANGEAAEGIYTVRGLFATGFPGYDESTLFMPLASAQAFTGVGDRASAIMILLHDQEDADTVAAALQAPGLTVLTWRDLNAILLETIAAGIGFYYIMYAIVILIVAVIIANTLLMAVFERTREIGILAALGMRGRQITVMFLLESTILALVGIAVGILLGSVIVIYLSNVGIDIGDASSTLVEGINFGTKMYPAFDPGSIIGLSLATLIIVLLVSIYPAWFAARMEPVEALHTQ